jgi:aminoglycoside phosphotransferase (APT) family kinase protein
MTYTDEVEQALAQHGIAARTVDLVSPLGARKGRRWAYRIEAHDGRVVKARQFENEEEARRVFEIRAGLEDAFAPVIARHRAILVEEWIDGVPLAEGEWAARAEEAGALLGRLHARPLALNTPAAFDTVRWRDGVESDLDLLAGAGKLGADEIAQLREEIGRRDPATARAAVVHLDFCADNMLIDPRGRLRVIDNEMMGVGPPGFDLGRTFNLWPMADSARTAFRSGYDSSAPQQPQAMGFWRIVACALGARIFLERDPARRTASLAQLRRLAAGEFLDDA